MLEQTYKVYLSTLIDKWYLKNTDPIFSEKSLCHVIELVDDSQLINKYVSIKSVIKSRLVQLLS